jgi:signal transduction histidine kinase
MGTTSWIVENSLPIVLLAVELLLLLRSWKTLPRRATPAIILTLAALAAAPAVLALAPDRTVILLPVGLAVLAGAEQAIVSISARRARPLRRSIVLALTAFSVIVAVLSPGGLLPAIYGALAAMVITGLALARMRRMRLFWSLSSWWSVFVALLLWTLALPATAIFGKVPMVAALGAAHLAVALALSDRGRFPKAGKTTFSSERAGLARLERDLASQQHLATAGTLAAGAVHELRSVLSNVRIAAQWGLKADEERREEAFSLILGSVESALGDTSRLLGDLSGLRREPRSIVGVAELLSRGVEAIRSSTPVPAGISLQHNAPKDLSVNTRPVEIHQVLLVLLRNAVRAAERCGHACRVRASGRHAGADVEIEVADDAGGVPMAVRGSSVAEMGRHGGASLGLRLAARIAELNGGRLDHFSRGELTVFRLVLPSAPADEHPSLDAMRRVPSE